MASRFLRLPDVKLKTGQKTNAIYSDPTFPAPVPIGVRSVAWVEAEVDAWMESKIEQRERPSSSRKGGPGRGHKGRMAARAGTEADV
jgi:prophage regulatory protein